MKRLWAVYLVLLGLALAHAEYRSSTPMPNATVKQAPKAITIRFSEAVEVRLSTFKVYPLGAPEEVWGSPARLRRLAQPLVHRVLSQRGDASRRMDTGVSAAARTSQSVTISLKPGLKPGPYVVMWRNLAVDGHSQTDFFVFVFRP